jgi:chromate transporter
VAVFPGGSNFNHNNPGSLFQKYGRHSSIKAFVDGTTTAVIGASAGAVTVITMRTLKDITTAFIAATVTVLLKAKNVKEPYTILIAALLNLLLKSATFV